MKKERRTLQSAGALWQYGIPGNFSGQDDGQEVRDSPGYGFRSAPQLCTLLSSLFTVQVTHYPGSYCTGHPIPE